MENKIEELTDKRRLITGDNVSLKAKFEVVAKLEKEVHDKFNMNQEIYTNKISVLKQELNAKNKERNELEAINRATEHEIKLESQKNKELDFNLQNTAKLEEMFQKDYENSLMLRDNLNKSKENEYLEIDQRIKVLNGASSEDPIVKAEYEKNLTYKKRIEDLERELIMANFRVEELECVNDLLIKRKEEVIQERKKFILNNEELKRDIESKTQINEMRIQKKVKENNSEEIQKLHEDLKDYISKGDEFEKKIQVEYDKSKTFASEIIKNNIEIKIREAKKEKFLEEIDEKYKVIEELESKLDDVRAQHDNICDRISKANTENVLLKNRNKLLTEEHASITSKLNYIMKNFDTSSNLKKISMDDMRVLTQTNNMVNDSINAFVSKVGTFKTNLIPRNIFDDNAI